MQAIFSECRIIMVVCLLLVAFSIVLIVMVVFVLHIAAICIILLHMGLRLQWLLFSHQLLLKKVVLKASDAFYYFRVNNDGDYKKIAG